MIEEARALDAADPLAGFRDRFVISDPELIYLDGNSLGRMPKAAAAVLDRMKHEWGDRLVRGWGEGWYDLPQRLGAKIANLIGAREDEVIVCDSTSVNLYKAVIASLEHQLGKRVIITDDTNFPSDLYVMQGATSLTKHRAIALEAGSEGFLYDHEIIRGLDAFRLRSALLALSHTAFKSGYVHPMKSLSEAASSRDMLNLWDISHSVGAMPIKLNACGVDFAVGCTYKYLNGGPGSPAFLFVRKDLQSEVNNPIRGWFGQRDPFKFSAEYAPADGVRRFLAGTPPILSMAAAEPGIDLVIEAGTEAIRRKSVLQTEYLVRLFDEHLAPLGFTFNSPRDSSVRGSHVSIGHPKAYQIDQALIHEMKVIPDFREPDNLRLGVAPLYTRFEDLHEGVIRIKRVVEEGLFAKYADVIADVT